MKSNWILVLVSIGLGISLFLNFKSCGGGVNPPLTTISDTTVVIDTIRSNDTIIVYKTVWREKIVEVPIPNQDTSLIYTLTDITNHGDSIAVMDTIDVRNNTIIRHGQRVALNSNIYRDTTTITKIVTIRDTIIQRELVYDGQTPTKFLYGGTMMFDQGNTDFSADLILQTNIGHFRLSKSLMDVERFDVGLAIPFKRNKRD